MSQTSRLLLLAPDAMIRTPAFDRATELALALELALHIVAIDYLELLSVGSLFAPDQAKQAREGYLETHRHWLSQQAELARRHGVEVTCEVVWDKDAFQALQQYIKESPLALIIKDAQPEPVIKRIFFTPLDWRLLRDCPVPVHLVTDSRNPRPRRVLAIVDVLRSEEQDLVFNDQIVDAAVKLAEQCNGVMPQQRHFVEGAPLSSICTFAADHQADVIVMGTTAHHGLDKRLGTTAELLLQRAPCSVWAIKPQA